MYIMTMNIHATIHKTNISIQITVLYGYNSVNGCISNTLNNLQTTETYFVHEGPSNTHKSRLVKGSSSCYPCTLT